MSEAAQPSDADATLISGDSMIGEIVGLGRLGPGKRLGRYIVLARIGAGEHGIVYAAHDPELDRRVAIKLLRPRAGDEFVREAERAAAVSHPNLVGIRKVGSVHQVAFVVMDYVDGVSMREWLDQGPHPWPVCVEILRKLAAGLAAAHRAGLVHAKLTPDNVLLDAELDPRITDLGLARAAVVDADDQPPSKSRVARQPKDGSSDALAAVLTPTEQRRGTWAYLAPELHEGERPDALSDQFGFCVLAYEALFGERPFEGRSIRAVLQAISEGRLRTPPPRARVPTRLRRVLVRGLANHPSQRWPNMDALLHALEHDIGRRGQRTAAGLAAGVALLAASLAATRPTSFEPSTSAPTCTTRDATVALDSAWSAERRTALEQRLAEVGGLWAKPMTTSLPLRLDAWAEAWQAEWIDACAATRIRGQQPEALLARRLHCLDRQRDRVAAYASALLDAAPPTLADALIGVETLDQLEACRLDPARLPDTAAQREQVVALARPLDSVRALLLADQPERAREQLRRVSAEIRATDWNPLVAELELLDARARLADARTQPSAPLDLEDLTNRRLPAALGDAQAGGDLRLAVEIALELAALSSWPEHEPGVAWLELAERLAEQNGQPKLRAATWLERARLESDAQTLERQVLPLLAELCDDHSPLLAEAEHMLARAAFSRGDYERADAALARARERWARLGGDNHPRSLDLLETAGEFALARGKLRDAERLLGELAARSEFNEQPPGPSVADRLVPLATAQIRQGEFMFARASLERAVAIYAEPEFAELPGRVGALAALAMFEAQHGKPEAALAHARQALEAGDEPGVDRRDLATARRARAQVVLVRGRLDEAEDELEAARELAESTEVLIDLHRLLVERGDLEQAEAMLRRAEAGVRDPWHRVRLALLRRRLCEHHECSVGEVDHYAIARREFAELQNPDPALAWDFDKLLAEPSP